MNLKKYEDKLKINRKDYPQDKWFYFPDDKEEWQTRIKSLLKSFPENIARDLYDWYDIIWFDQFKNGKLDIIPKDFWDDFIPKKAADYMKNKKDYMFPLPRDRNNFEGQWYNAATGEDIKKPF